MIGGGLAAWPENANGAATHIRSLPAWLMAGLVSAGMAGCTVPPAPCAIANDALAVTGVARDPAGFRVTVANRAMQPLTEKIFIEAAIVEAGRPLVAGSTATTATWPAGGSLDLAVPVTIDAGPPPGTYETFTHLKCLSE